MSIIALFASVAFANPVTIHVSDPQVEELVFNCDGATSRSKVRNGVATMPQVPGECTVFFHKRIGSIDGPGTYSCSAAGCTLDEVHHRVISDGPATVNIVLTSKVDAHQMEINCPSGHRDRQNIETNTVVFNGVPAGQECTILFKGGVPAQYRKIRAGTYYCGLSGTQAVCTRK